MKLNKILGLLAIGAVSLLGGVDSALGQAFVPPVLTPGVDYTLPHFLYSPPLRKFVTAVPGVGAAGANEIGQYMAIATPDTTTYSKAAGRPNDDDYYEIALVEYREQMHPDLPPVLGADGLPTTNKLASVNGGTQLRGYVQIETPVIAAKLQAAGSPSKHIPLQYPGGAPILINGSQAYAVDYPHYLGPSILATSDKAVRLLFRVLLPTGSKGKLFIPSDSTIMGAAEGPNQIGTDAQGMPIYEWYTDNRATIHLHGGLPPWISDGTPHQWVSAQGENTSYKRGVSAYNVPDMPDPGEGALTFYFPNQMSARLQFYHDHAFGLTGPNVYVGEAAGYIILDKPGTGEWTLPGITGLGIGGVGIPLVIQDRTFLPDPATVQALDPTWNTVGPWNLGPGLAATWGTNGNFWYPHVYIPNQNPYDESGWNPMGRWAYGPWFWPPWPVPAGSTPPNPTHVPEAFMDTPMVNGTPYPYMNVEPKAYRFRVLNACNDRTLNLSLWKAEPLTIGIGNGGAGYTAPIITVAAPLSGGTAATATAQLDDGGTILGVNMTSYGSGYTNLEMPVVTITDSQGGTGSGAEATASVLTDVAMIPAVSPRYSTVPIPAYYPGADLRDGGWPDPRNSGPNFVQIGTEGGLLPKPVKIENRPIGYVLDKGNVVVLNVQERALNMACAERADVIVDFSQFAGKTVILYNDSGAPVPAGDPRYDLYTGCPDQVDASGAPSTRAGYGPNTRTVMQFRVANTTPQPYNMSGLSNALTAAFKATQPTPIVPQIAYDSIYNRAGAKTNVYSRIASTELEYVPYGTNRGIVMPMLPKCIQELFDDIGRLNTILGTEVKFTNGRNQTTVPLNYVDPTTELYNDGEIQLWKITHNGVDTHPIHFHLYNVQVVNRVGWDNIVRPPEDNELGWKETVRMNPLEDCIVAARALSPTNLPFLVPDSVRPLNPARPLGSLAGFANLDPLTGNAFVPPVSNVLASFAWEYVWHCHILAHEENDMMRPLVMQVAPDAPSNLRATPKTTAPINIRLAWNDNSPSVANPNKEAGFIIERADVVNNVTNAFAQLAAVGQNVTTYTNTTVSAGRTYAYRVSAFNAGISQPSGVTRVTSTPIADLIGPSGIITSNNPVFTFTPPTGGVSYKLWFTNTANRAVFSLPANTTYLTAAVAVTNGIGAIATNNLVAPGTYNWTIVTRPSNGVATAPAAFMTITIVVPAAPTLIAPSGLVVTNAPTFTFSAAQYATDYEVVVSNLTAATSTTSAWLPAASLGVANGTGTGSWLYNGTPLTLASYAFTMRARDQAGTSAYSAFTAFTLATPVAPVIASPNGDITNAIPTFAFAASATATDYQIVLSNGVTGTLITSPWDTAASAGVPAGTGSGSLPWWGGALTVGNYMWAIQAKNPLGTGSLSAFTAFRIVGPPAPTQLAPNGTITTPLPTFTFGAIQSATDYKIVLHDASTYTTSAWFTASAAGVGSGTGTGSYTWTGTPLLAGNYSWSITARSAVGPGTDSTYQSFTMAAPGAPAQIAPTGTTPVDPPVFSFTAVADATDYQIIVSNGPSGTFTTSAWFTASSANVPTGVGTGSYTWASPLVLGTYQWAIHAKSAAGAGSYSGYLPFTIVLPAAPVQISPLAEAYTGESPVFSFSASLGATEYRLILWTATGGVTNGVWQTAASAGVPSGVGTGSLQWSTGLVQGGRYNWSVQARSVAGVGVQSGWLALNINIPVNALTPISPINSIVGVASNFTFSPLTGATAYKLRLNGVDSRWYSPSEVGLIGAAVNGTFTIAPPLTNIGSSSWRVFATTTTGTTPGGTTAFFTVVGPSSPIPISPLGDQVTTVNPEFRFQEVSGATDYRITLWTQAGGTVQGSWVPASTAVSQGVGVITWAAPLTPGQRYFWGVTARVFSAVGSQSAWNTFIAQ